MPSFADIVIVILVAVTCFFSVRSVVRNMRTGKCSSCASAPACAAAGAGGECPITGDVVEKMDEAARQAAAKAASNKRSCCG